MRIRRGLVVLRGRIRARLGRVGLLVVRVGMGVRGLGRGCGRAGLGLGLRLGLGLGWVGSRRVVRLGCRVGCRVRWWAVGVRRRIVVWRRRVRRRWLLCR